jgi:hypothetical protein
METGTVAKIEGNKVLWKSDKTGEFIIDEISKMEKI